MLNHNTDVLKHFSYPSEFFHSTVKPSTKLPLLAAFSIRLRLVPFEIKWYYTLRKLEAFLKIKSAQSIPKAKAKGIFYAKK